MITKHDILRTLREFYSLPYSHEEWLRRVDVNADDVIGVMGQIGNVMWEHIASCDTDEEGREDAIAATVASLMTAFSVGMELGRQYPQTPFEEG